MFDYVSAYIMYMYVAMQHVNKNKRSFLKFI